MPWDPVRSRTPFTRTIGIGALVLAFAGCAAGAPAGEVAPVITRPAPEAVAAASSIAYAPLRGTLTDSAVLARPSLAVKIDNHADARPQIALNRADIVFEELVEGGITRYAAVWHSDVPDELGPVRSIRPMDPDIIVPFGGLVAYSGGQEQFVAMMQDTPVVNLVFDYDDTGLFWRADDRPGPHDVILAAAEAVQRHADRPAPGVQFAYGAQDPLAAAPGAAPTGRIDLVFSDARYPTWEWEAESSTWVRSQEGGPDFEASGDRVRATNVVTMRVDVDWSLGEVPRTVLVGEGEVWVSAAGRTAHGRWTKPDRESPITLTADDGTPLRLAPGTTWVELVPPEGAVTFTP
ncbi:DUF3048 domain-containing protein [Agromyces aerolatus]|uniref:DUF3048 domain-containing protein n=1 Tax=Agromyces sp. LY-1074 TaxID=3074080 RepID=UPI00286021E1|nr:MULTISPECIES: DUF3048 domain-containing protein [unclassified Agromyces]MDR5699707.1 DUF3048 domain-containing protein [Agromyces sp. LY-1074]MDR5706003.1 DUF3048 domain-containing protein [Agromyces sp. LY-1358]